MRAWLLLVIAALPACSGDEFDDPDARVVTPEAGMVDMLDGARSGTRLKLVYYDFTTARSLFGIHDKDRNEMCSVETWDNGQTLCTPDDRGAIAYSDAGCTQRMGQVYRDTGCTRPPPAYFAEYGTGCRAGVSHLYPRGAKLATNMFYVKLADGTCDGPTTTTLYDFYALGPELQPSALVPITTTAPSTTGRIGMRYHESADGLRYPNQFALHDALFAVACAPTHKPGGTAHARCEPRDPGYGGYFADPGCAVARVVANAECPAPKYAVKSSTCAVDPDPYFTVGAQVTPTTIYYDSGSSCSATSVSSMEKVYTLGVEVAVAELERARAGSGGRLEPIYFSTAEGLRTRDTELYDAVKETDCSPVRTANNGARCIPTGGSVITYYTTSTCTTPIKLVPVSKGEASCSPPPLPAHAIEYVQNGTCGFDEIVSRVGSVYTGPMYFKLLTSCFQVMPPTTIMYRLGAEVPASEIATGMLVTEP